MKLQIKSRWIIGWLLAILYVMAGGRALAQSYTLVSDLQFTGSASAPGSAGGNVGTSANWTGGYAPYQDTFGNFWSIVTGVFTPAGGQSWTNDWALRPSSEDAVGSKIVAYTPAIASGDVYGLLLRANRSTRTGYSVWFQPGVQLVIHTLNGSGGFGNGNVGSVTTTIGHSYIITFTAVPGTAGTTTVSASVADATAPSTPVGSVSLVNDNSTAEQSAGSAGVFDYLGSSKFTRLQTYVTAASTSFVLSPTTATTGSPLTITATGTGTSWTSGTTFSVAGGTGASISSISVNASTQVATFTLNPGSAAGSLTISDSADSATGTITVSAPTGLTTGTLSIASSTATSISFTVSAPGGGTAPYTAKVYRTSPAIGGFVPPGAGTQIGGTISSFPQTFTDSSPGANLNSYKVVWTDSTSGTALTAVSLPAFGQVTNGTPLVIVFIGDSFDTQSPGFETSPVTEGNLIQQWTGRAVTVVNQGSSGTTSGNWVPGSTSLYANMKAAATSAGVTHFIIRLGLNDTQSGLLTTAATYQSNMQSIITQLQTDFPGIPIQLDYHSTPVASTTFPEATSLALLLQYQSKIIFLASANTGVYIGDTRSWKLFAQRADLLSDGIHPGQDGMVFLAENGARAFLVNFFPALVSGSGAKRKVQ